MPSRYKHSVVGGTFDHFHKGHEKLLAVAFSQSEKVTIGVSTETLYKKKILSDFIEAYDIREEFVMDFLKVKNFDRECQIISIDDIYGTTLEEKNIDAIFVTEENKKAADLINTKREEQGFKQLEIVVVPFVNANDDKPISSDRIRVGEIDRSGFVYKSLFENKKLQLPKELRAKLREPIGEVTTDIHVLVSKTKDASAVITVGDIVTVSLLEAGIKPDVSIVDFKTRRQDLQVHQKALLELLTESTILCSNKAGEIASEAAIGIYDMIQTFVLGKKKQTMTVKGEEDLLTLPAILFAPLGSVVIYGQYDEGAVLVDVTEEKKKEIFSLIKQFTQE